MFDNDDDEQDKLKKVHPSELYHTKEPDCPLCEAMSECTNEIVGILVNHFRPRDALRILRAATGQTIVACTSDRQQAVAALPVLQADLLDDLTEHFDKHSDLESENESESENISRTKH